jgi:hypothetical protein
LESKNPKSKKTYLDYDITHLNKDLIEITYKPQKINNYNPKYHFESFERHLNWINNKYREIANESNYIFCQESVNRNAFILIRSTPRKYLLE